ncbi:MAG: class I SAM-dependent methyltransferase family protein [Candidatus Micrarchaeia archaeon]
MVIALKVEKKHAEKARRFLISKKLINFNYNPSSDNEFIFFPLDENIEERMEELNQLDFKFELCKKRLRKKENKKVSLPPFDIIGDVAIFELPKEYKDLSEKQKENISKKIASDIMEQHKNIKSVAVKTGGIKGPFRIRSFKVVAGRHSTLTIHKEHGCRFKLDVSKAYYSPRLSYERKRINSLVKDGETVFVPFAGVGPFALIIAKNHPNSKVYANELNPDAYSYLIENIKLNKLTNVIPIPGDARDLLKKKEYEGVADRVIMPLPMSADQFLDVAFYLVKNGGIVHFYHFTDSIENAEKIVNDAAKKQNKKIKILQSRLVRDYSPDIIEVVVDFQVLNI